jgi:TatD DNase family protein
MVIVYCMTKAFYCLSPPIRMFVDSHCHLNYPELQKELPQVLAAMRAAHVDRALCICTTLEEFEGVHALALEHPHLWATVGVHPDNEDVQEPTASLLANLAQHERVVAIGETGLDYYRLNGRSLADMEWQRDRFRAHIRAAQSVGKPLVIHTRSASDDTLAILREEGEDQNHLPAAATLKPAGGVFHCFTESMAVAKAALDMGFYISFSGILTFKNAAELREVAAYVPMDRTLIETDSPYLAPAPHRGKTNTPAYVPLVAAQLAAVRGISVEEVAHATTANFEHLFGIAPVVA